MVINESIEVEWLMLADCAQVVTQKLYVLGGGWNRIVVQKEPPVSHRMAVALAIKVPWTRTNEPHSIDLEILDGDGAPLAKVGGQFEVGRPPRMAPGQAQRTQIALDVNLNIKKVGTYEIVARVNGQSEKREPFYVVPSDALAMRLHQKGEDAY